MTAIQIPAAATAQVVVGEQSLDQIATAVVAHHKQGTSHAVEAGRLLSEAKGRLSHGEWLPWLALKCGIPRRTAAHYIEQFKLASLAHFAGQAAEPSGTPVRFARYDRLVELFMGSLPSDQTRFAEWSAEHARNVAQQVERSARECKITPDDALVELDYAAAVSAIANNLGPETRNRILAGDGGLSKPTVISIARRSPKAQRRAIARALSK